MTFMQFEKLTFKKVVSYHLSLRNEIDEKTTVFSSLVAVLRDAREITGRDLENGKRMESPPHGRLDSWLGASGYLTLLDQIGKCYRPKNKEKIRNSNNIYKALKYFTHLKEDEIKSIYALRCAFSHDYSLFNIGRKGANDKLTQHFTVTGEGYTRLISLPKKQWNGKHLDKSLENFTTINLPLLGDLVEGIYNCLVEYFNTDELEVDLEGGYMELKNRYILFVYKTSNGV